MTELDPTTISPKTARAAHVVDLLDRTEAALVAYATRSLGGDLDAGKDAVQETFLRLCRHPDALDLGRPWLYTAVRNFCIDRRRPLEPQRHPQPILQPMAQSILR